MPSFQKSSEFSDVTLVQGDEKLVCRHFQTGFCKFGESCKKQHVKENCQTKTCLSKICKFRHPKPCKYFMRNQSCKFGNSCAYEHIEHTDTHIGDLQRKVDALQAKVDEMGITVNNLEAKLLKLSVNQCESCDYKASSITALKAHVTKKHKDTISPEPEMERSKTSDVSLHISSPAVERDEPHDPSDISFSISEEGGMECDYWLCDFAANSENELTEHITTDHTIESTFIYPNSSEPVTCDYDVGPQNQFPDCEECGEEFLLDHSFAMHLYNAHKVGYKCAHCQKYYPGGDEMYTIHLRMCTVPCGGNPRCPCQFD